MNKLSKVPSILIIEAVADLIDVENDNRYKVNMSVWHGVKTTSTEKCEVCLGGSVIAKTLKHSISEEAEPETYSSMQYSKNNLEGKLNALDCFRQGNIDEAFLELGLDTEVEFINEHFEKRLSFNSESDFDDHLEEIRIQLEAVIPKKVSITPYKKDKEKFKSDLVDLSMFLQGVGF